MTNRLEAWQWLLSAEGAALVEAATQTDLEKVAGITRLRERWRPESVRLAVELVRARRKAANKFPDFPGVVADVEGMEQATSARVAAHKAARFATAEPERIFDLCCGIGGDAMALARVAPLVVVDRDPVRAWMALANARAWGGSGESRCVEVEQLDIAGEVVHLDPSRRRLHKKRWRFEDYEPSPEVIEDLLERNPDAAVKLGPGIELPGLPKPDEREIEFISDGGDLVQAVMWSGRLAHRPGQRTATRLPSGECLHGFPAAPPARDEHGFDRYLFLPDPSVERAQLLTEIPFGSQWVEPSPGLGLLTGDELEPSGWGATFEVLDEVPWRPTRVRRWLRENDRHVTEVRTRGGAVDVEEAHRSLRIEGSRPVVVFVLRLERRVRAVLATPAATSPE